MAPIKFEEQLKDKLEKRSLEPSADSWAKLSERLDADEKKSRNPWFWWMGIAAGFVIMLAIAVQAFGSKDAQNIDPVLVEDKNIEYKTEDQKPDVNNENTIELAVEDEPVEIENENIESVKQPEIINYKTVTNKKPISKPQLATINDKEKVKVKVLTDNNQAEDIIKKEAIINTTAVAKAIESFKPENTSVTDREVDSLLKLASKELFKDKLKKETRNTVNANDLLLEVEEDMGQSFRSKVFEALKDSYETVKTAVAERNN